MGMDINGIGNKEAYFRANIWSWRPIYSILVEIASDIIPKDVLDGMQYNNGAGLKTKWQCEALANRLSTWLETNSDGRALSMNHMLCKKDNFMVEGIKEVMSGLTGAMSGAEVRTQTHYVDDEHLRGFVDFLNKCEGFEVW